eukprot:scaffold29367_cov48-Phaeocystis_antarctica.AAC.1
MTSRTGLERHMFPLCVFKGRPAATSAAWLGLGLGLGWSGLELGLVLGLALALPLTRWRGRPAAVCRCGWCGRARRSRGGRRRAPVERVRAPRRNRSRPGRSWS